MFAVKAYAKWGYNLNKKSWQCNRVRKFHSADSNEQIGQVTKNFTTANIEYLGPQFTVHLNVNFRFCKESPLTFKVSRGKKFCNLPNLFIAISWMKYQFPIKLSRLFVLRGYTLTFCTPRSSDQLQILHSHSRSSDQLKLVRWVSATKVSDQVWLLWLNLNTLNDQPKRPTVTKPPLTNHDQLRPTFC